MRFDAAQQEMHIMLRSFPKTEYGRKAIPDGEPLKEQFAWQAVPEHAAKQLAMRTGMTCKAWIQKQMDKAPPAAHCQRPGSLAMQRKGGAEA